MIYKQNPKLWLILLPDQEFLDKVVQLVEENLSDLDFLVETLLQHFSSGRTVLYKKMKGFPVIRQKIFYALSG